MAPLAITGEMKQLSTCLSLPAHAAAITTLGNLKGMTRQEKVYWKTQTAPKQPDSHQDIHYITQAVHSVQHPGQCDYSKGWTLRWPYGSALQLTLLPYGTGVSRRLESATGFVTKTAIFLPSIFKRTNKQTQTVWVQHMNRSGCRAHPQSAQKICIRQIPHAVTQTACPLSSGSVHTLLAQASFLGRQPCQR